VAIDLPVDVMMDILDPYSYPSSARLPGRSPRTMGNSAWIKKPANAIGRALEAHAPMKRDRRSFPKGELL